MSFHRPKIKNKYHSGLLAENLNLQLNSLTVTLNILCVYFILG